jgi:hypothetical protein
VNAGWSNSHTSLCQRLLDGFGLHQTFIGSGVGNGAGGGVGRGTCEGSGAGDGGIGMGGICAGKGEDDSMLMLECFMRSFFSVANATVCALAHN